MMEYAPNAALTVFAIALALPWLIAGDDAGHSHFYTGEVKDDPGD